MEAFQGEGKNQVGEPERPELCRPGIFVKILTPGYQPRLCNVTKVWGVIVAQLDFKRLRVILICIWESLI